jgi:acetyl-CoA acetyltransferase
MLANAYPALRDRELLTAGNTLQITDGEAAVLVMSEDPAQRFRLDDEFQGVVNGHRQ